jgi:hypothetical protein
MAAKQSQDHTENKVLANAKNAQEEAYLNMCHQLKNTA